MSSQTRDDPCTSPLSGVQIMNGECTRVIRVTKKNTSIQCVNRRNLQKSNCNEIQEILIHGKLGKSLIFKVRNFICLMHREFTK